MENFSKNSSLFTLPCGVNFAHEIANGISERYGAFSPVEIARIEIFVNTSRLKKDILDAFRTGPATLLPKVRLIGEITSNAFVNNLPSAKSPLKLRLELAQLITVFLKNKPEFAPKSAVFDLADSLAGLISEMQDEGVTEQDLQDIKVQNSSEHWQTSLQFLSIIFSFLETDTTLPSTPEARLKMAVNQVVKNWELNPPTHPIILAGSTGSRDTTASLMEAIEKLPNGAIIFPGYDDEMPPEVWDELSRGDVIHPQERIVRFANRIGISKEMITAWTQLPPPNSTQNRLISLAMRPAPVTDHWMSEGPDFQNVPDATSSITLIETPDLRLEANSIALIMRQAAADEKRIALITPDRALARRVTAALDRWNINPDDSAGIPLNQTPPGRIFRHISDVMGKKITTEETLILLKNPLASAQNKSDQGGRGYHLLWTRELEIYLRKQGCAYPNRNMLLAWATKHKSDPDQLENRLTWVRWVSDLIDACVENSDQTICTHLHRLINFSQNLVSGYANETHDELWAKSSGRKMAQLVEQIDQDARDMAPISIRDFSNLFRAILGREVVTDPSSSNPNIMIWGTLEARFLDADIVILGGLNENTWPQPIAPDPWFNRSMRHDAGLISPDQKTGLSAHDFQQAIAAKCVYLTRSKRDAEAETVPSRWLARLTNLMSGMSQDGQVALQSMRSKGDAWIKLAQEIDKPDHEIAPAHRPSPRPPIQARPRQLSVTRIETLIRDPYEIYASRILKLNKLSPLSADADARDRGTAIHEIMERYVQHVRDETSEESVARLISIAETVLEEMDDHPATSRIWLGHMRRIATDLVKRERARLQMGHNVATEEKGALHFPEVDFSLTGKADRIDRKHEDGTYLIYDYKSGKPPSAAQIRIFSIQLLLEAVMLERGKFDTLEKGHVSEVTYLGLSKDLDERNSFVDHEVIDETYNRLVSLIKSYDDPAQGYTSRRLMERVSYASDFEHLARFGEWSSWDEPTPEDME